MESPHGSLLRAVGDRPDAGRRALDLLLGIGTARPLRRHHERAEALQPQLGALPYDLKPYRGRILFGEQTSGAIGLLDPSVATPSTIAELAPYDVGADARFDVSPRFPSRRPSCRSTRTRPVPDVELDGIVSLSGQTLKFRGRRSPRSGASASTRGGPESGSTRSERSDSSSPRNPRIRADVYVPEARSAPGPRRCHLPDPDGRVEPGNSRIRATPSRTSALRRSFFRTAGSPDSSRPQP